jgi:hypothetical protein
MVEVIYCASFLVLNFELDFNSLQLLHLLLLFCFKNEHLFFVVFLATPSVFCLF